MLWLFETQLFVSADRSPGQQRQGEKKKEKGNRTESEKGEEDREGARKGPGDFTHVGHKIHTFTRNSCKGRLTEKLERKLRRPATKVCNDSTLSIPLPIVALSS